jgi:hypothetical protein
MKAIHFKKILMLSKFTYSRLSYILTREPYLLEDLRLKILLLSTTAYKEVMDERQRKEMEIWEEFYRLMTVMNREWTGPNYRL